MAIEKKAGDWLPSNKEKVLEMANDWIAYITTARATAWGIPADDMTALAAKRDTAQTRLAAATGENRGPKATEACDEAFADLKAHMRKIKERHFFLDPLTGDDFVALGLRVPDQENTETPTPDEAPAFTMSHGDFMVVVVRHDAKGKGIGGAVLNYAVLPLGAPAPTHDQLTQSQLLTKPIERLTFPDTMKGMELHASLSWQTSSAKKGPPSDIQTIVLG